MNRNNHEPLVDADLSAEGLHWVKSFLNQPEGVIPPKQADWLTTENVKNRIKMEKDTRAFDWKCLRGTCTLQEIEWTLQPQKCKMWKKVCSWYVSRASGTETRHPPWTQRHDAAIVSELSGESEVLGQSASTQYMFCTLWSIMTRGTAIYAFGEYEGQWVLPSHQLKLCLVGSMETWICTGNPPASSLLLAFPASSGVLPAREWALGQWSNDMDKPPSPQRCLKVLRSVRRDWFYFGPSPRPCPIRATSWRGFGLIIFQMSTAGTVICSQLA